MKHRSKLACALFACVMSTLPACALFTPDELRNQLRSTQMRLEEAEAKLGNSTSQKSALDAELDAAQARLRDLEARLLDAALEKAKLQKQALDLEIAAVRGKLDTIRRAEDQ